MSNHTSRSVHRDDLVLEHFDAIESTVNRVCRRAGWSDADADDFRSWVFLRLLEGDARILRRYRGAGTIHAYLRTVIRNLMRDFRNAQLGKWRPSAKAKALGATAVELERLVHRDGATRREAVAMLCNREPELDPATLLQLASALPARPQRREVSLDGTRHSVAAPDGTDHGLEARIAETEQRRVLVALEESIAALPRDDQLLLRLRYWDGMSVATVARSMGRQAKPLYRAFGRIHAKLAALLESHDISSREVTETLQHALAGHS